MLIKDLEKNIVIKELVNTIIADKDFKEKCKLNFEKIFEDGIQQNKTNIENNVYIYLKTLEQKDKVDKFFKYLSTLLKRYHIFQSRRFS